MRGESVVIVGGGISGLAAAWFLHRAGFVVTVLEAGAEPGGNAHTIERDGFLVDTGPTSTFYRGGALGQMLQDLGLESEILEADRQAPRYIVKQDRLIPLPTGLLDFIRTPLFSPSAKWRLLAEPFYRRAANEESIAAFTRRRLGAEFLDWAVDPFVSGVYAGDPERLSVRAATARLYALEAAHGSLLVGALWRGLRGNGGTHPRGRLISFRRGMQQLPNAIAAKLSGNVHLATAVTRIERATSGEWVAHSAAGDHRAAHLVLSLPAYRAAPLLAPLIPEAARALSEITYPPVASVALGFARAQVTHPLQGFGALIPRRAQRETLGVIFSSSLFPGRAPVGKVLLTAFVGGARNPGVCAGGERAAYERALADLRALLGVRGEPVFSHVSLWPRAIPQYELGHLGRVEHISACVAGLPGLHLRANWRDGVSLADSVSNASALAATLQRQPQAV